MHDFDIALALRNALVLQLLVIALAPEQAVVAVHRHLHLVWRRMRAPFLRREPPKKGSRFWEIDMTGFEP